jgi:predicted secreted hydrolase
MLGRRTLILGGLSLLTGGASAPAYAPVRPGRAFGFPRDHGAHPDFRTEWWYLTGWLDAGDGRQLGFQVTFFRFRSQTDQANPSAFAPKQILFAHAALADPGVGRLLHDQRAARAGFSLAEASEGDTDVAIDDWSLRRLADGRFLTSVKAKDFALDLGFRPTQPLLLQGEAGFSRKGPKEAQASYYYSQPHLAVTGSVVRAGKPLKVTGEAWLDREWSSSYLDPQAVGWDWTGLNLADGGALTAFRIRDAAGRALWAGGSFRDPAGAMTVFAPNDVRFEPARRWRSPRTGAVYPVETAVIVRLPAGERRFALKPLLDDQELDSRSGGGPVYWEGAVSAPGARGYLELTGYVSPLKM